MADTESHPRLADGELVLRPRRPGDAAAIAALLAEPEVGRWWPDGEADDDGWVIEVDGAFAGWLQACEEPGEWFPSVALDIGLTTALHGRGYGRRALRLAIEHFRARGHHRFTIDPETANARAIRCYRAVGFEPVGVMRAYMRDPHGGWSDGLLMDLVFLD